jgi:hypothetical protein
LSAGRARLVALALLASGCGTISIHPRLSFSLQSIPDNASFELREAHHPDEVIKQGTTPAPFSLQRGYGYFRAARYSVVVSKEGYESQAVEFTPSVSGWYWANLLWTPLLPPWPIVGMLIVDPLNGAMWDIDIPRVVMLEKSTTPAPASQP